MIQTAVKPFWKSATVFIGAMAMFSASLAAPVANAASESLAAVVDGTHRTEDEKSRDAFRHPMETLTFFQVEPDMAVAEVSPGNSGWYTNILAPYLRDAGAYTAVIYDRTVTEGYVFNANKEFMAKFSGKQDLYGDFEITDFASDGRDIAPDGSQDRVLTFRNTHGWMGGEYADAMFAAMYRALKPGGMMGLVQHRQRGTIQANIKADNGYVAESYVIRLAEAAGFELVERSEINANPADTKDHAGGVWTLPPTLGLKDKMSAEELEGIKAIGESDRMTLLFRKPDA